MENTKKTKEQLTKWITKEITSNKYTTEELELVMILLKKNDKKKALKLLFKSHSCIGGNCDYCQYALSLPIEFEKTYTWQGKIKKAERLTKLAEREVKEAEQLRIKEATNLLFNNPQEFFKYDRKQSK